MVVSSSVTTWPALSRAFDQDIMLSCLLGRKIEGKKEKKKTLCAFTNLVSVSIEISAPMTFQIR